MPEKHILIGQVRDIEPDGTSAKRYTIHVEHCAARSDCYLTGVHL